MRTLVREAITTAPRNPKLASMLHFVERVPGVEWPPTVPARGQRLRPRGVPRVVDDLERPGAAFGSTLRMEPIVPVYAAPWALPLPVSTVILPKDEALKALEAAMGDERRRQATWLTDGSLLDGRAGGAAVRVEGGKEKERIVVPLGKGQVCEGEMEGLCQATGKAIWDGHDDVLVVADSQAALRGHLVHVPALSALPLRPHLTILNLWTPAHIGTLGNELADAAAKEATTRPPDPSTFVSLTTVRRLIQLQVLGEWDILWKNSKTGGDLRRIDKSPPSLIPISLYSSLTIARKTSSHISQLRTGPCHLNAYRFKSGFITLPACEACGAPYETRAHFLLECPAWEPHRQPLHAAARKAGIFGPLHVTPLLSEPKLLRSLANFVEATNRFM
ncbi:reverse transcriptase [Mycena venus]|uniref:Reverse transcriptase n=1 Tax=Mycena venus TaxID=2733690 RepID=A0A8H7DGF5_9AGAR|nr:reverse transcriptase [Mycena venus]